MIQKYALRQISSKYDKTNFMSKIIFLLLLIPSLILADGLREEGNVIDGKRDGIWKTFNSQGNLIIEGSYSDGLRNGPWKEYTSDGKMILSSLI